MANSVLPTREQLESAPTIHLKHPGRWIGALILLLLFSMVISAALTNDRFDWSTVGKYLFAEPILAGIILTIELTIIATVIALVIGIALALMKGSQNPVMRWASAIYIWFFRSVPLLVQLIFFYNISALFPKLSLGIPYGPEFISGNVNHLITPFIAAVLAFSLNESAYTAETVRGGLISVGHGQVEAGKALGLSQAKVMRLIVLPQALKVIIPPFGNQVVNLLKMTSLVSVIALADLLYSAQLIYTKTFETIPLLIVVSIWYLVIVSIMTFGQGILERKIAADGKKRTTLISFAQNVLSISRNKSGKGDDKA